MDEEAIDTINYKAVCMREREREKEVLLKEID